MSLGLIIHTPQWTNGQREKEKETANYKPFGSYSFFLFLRLGLLWRPKPVRPVWRMEIRLCVHSATKGLHFLRSHLNWTELHRDGGRERGIERKKKRERGGGSVGGRWRGRGRESKRKSQRGSLKCGEETEKKDAVGLTNLLRHDKCGGSLDLRTALCHFWKSKEKTNEESQTLAL